MNLKFEYATEEERDRLIEENKSLYLIEDQILLSGKFLIFTDEKPIELEIKELKQKTELQDSAMQELMFMILPEINGGGM